MICIENMYSRIYFFSEESDLLDNGSDIEWCSQTIICTDAL